MLVLITWSVGMCLEAVVLFRGFQTRLTARFPVFYTYLFLVFASDLLRLPAYLWFPHVYTDVYWPTQFVSLLAGCAVLFEIYRLALRDFPGTARMVRNLLGVLFAGVLVKAVLTLHTDSPTWLDGAYVKLERDLRSVQSLGIAILVVLFLWYAIPLGRNLGGILLGYSAFVAMSVLQLTVVTQYGDKPIVTATWKTAQPLSYFAILGFWCYSLWKADEASRRHRTQPPPKDYNQIADKTGALLDEARSRLGSTVRP